MKTKIFCIILALIILTSCQYLPTRKEQIAIPEVHTGTQGIALEFLTDLPPSELYENNYFEILLKISNKGASEVKRGMLVLGIEEQQIIIEGEKDHKFDLKGKSTFNPEGDFEITQFRGKVRQLIPEISQHSTFITATACYPYKTEATAIVCIDTDIADVMRTKPCKPAKKTYSGGQGAPIAVKTVEPKMMTHTDPEKIKPEFLITIQNAGTGKAMATDKIYDACTGTPLGQDKWDAVEIKAMLSDQQLNCRPEKIKISQADTVIICSLEEGIDKYLGTYMAPLSIELEYGYLNKILKSINIKKLGQK